jgi:hypothetical protein
MPCVVDAGVPAGVFDAWSWCESDVVEWRTPLPPASFDLDRAIDAKNPAGLAFIMHAECMFLPRELGRLHVSGYGLRDEMALAPYAIDDATDLLYERRVRPRDVFWLAAGSLDALVWGLHDWVHFHNHGPFDDPPSTELQCDLVALAWLRLNAPAIGIDSSALARVEGELVALARSRFTDAGREAPFDLEAAFRRYPWSPRSLRPLSDCPSSIA